MFNIKNRKMQKKYAVKAVDTISYILGFLSLIGITSIFIYLIIGLISEAISANYSILFMLVLWIFTIIFIVIILVAIVLIWLLCFLNINDENTSNK